MSRFKTAAITPDYSAGIVGRRNGSRVRFWDARTATLSKWTHDPSQALSGPRVTVVDRLQPIEADTPVKVAQQFVQARNVATHYGRMTVAELRALADTQGIKIPSKARKADIITALTN